METIGAIVVCVVASGLAFLLGLRWTLGQPWGVIAGLLLGKACAGVYFVVALWAGKTWPGMLDPRLVGILFMVLLVVAGVLGAVCSWFGYRKSAYGGLF